MVEVLSTSAREKKAKRSNRSYSPKQLGTAVVAALAVGLGGGAVFTDRPNQPKSDRPATFTDVVAASQSIYERIVGITYSPPAGIKVNTYGQPKTTDPGFERDVKLQGGGEAEYSIFLHGVNGDKGGINILQTYHGPQDSENSPFSCIGYSQSVEANSDHSYEFTGVPGFATNVGFNFDPSRHFGMTIDQLDGWKDAAMSNIDDAIAGKPISPVLNNPNC